MRWIRLDVSWDDSPWLFDLPAESQLAWIKLLCHVKRDGSGGSCKAMAPEVAAKRWGISVTGVTALLGVAMADGALLAENGEWTVCNWAKYQDNDTTRAERQRRFRERSQVQNVADSNGVTGVTDGVTCRVTETETETEIVNTDAKASCRVLEDDCPHVEAIPIDDEADPNWFEMFWDAYPPRAGDRKRAASEDKFALAVKRGTDPRAIVAGAERYRAYCDATRKTKTELVQQATTWLNNRAWLEPFEIPEDAPSPPQRGSRRESPSEVYARLEAECRQRNQARGAA